MGKLKLIIIFISIAILLAAVYVLTKPVELVVEETEVSHEVSHEVVEIEEMTYELEMKDKDVTYKSTLTVDEFNVFKSDGIIKLEYFKENSRLIYDYDKDNNIIVFCYKDQTIIVNLNQESYSINYGSFEANELIELKAGELYVKLETFLKIFDIEYRHIEEPDFLLSIDMKSDEINDVQLNMNNIAASYPEKVMMTWEAVYSRNPNTSDLYEMDGLNIISPTWYDLVSGEGDIKSKQSEEYIEWADEMNYDLWPAVTNSFDLDMTNSLITNLDNRTEFINNLLSIYLEHGYQGINIDFENIYKSDKIALSQFIAELSSAFHREGLLVSMDVTFAGGSDTWSKCYDREVLGEWVDYICIMAYDEHWGSSPISGSVASLNWVDDNLANLVKEVDSNKIILGIPFYMRVWFERPSEEIVNHMKVTSDAITMHKMESILSKRDYNILWDEAAGQNYISFIDPVDNAVKKVWIEDEESLKLKVELVHKYGLKGIASWRRGYELESIWEVINSVLRE